MILEVIIGVIMGLVLIALGIVTALILNNRNSKECMDTFGDISKMFKDTGGMECIAAMEDLKGVKLLDEKWVRNKKNAATILGRLESKGALKMPPGDIWSEKERKENIKKFKNWAGL